MRQGEPEEWRKGLPAGQHGAIGCEEPMSCLVVDIAMSPGRTRLGKLGRGAPTAPDDETATMGPRGWCLTDGAGSTLRWEG